jgi:hypothetical protein
MRMTLSRESEPSNRTTTGPPAATFERWAFGLLALLLVLVLISMTTWPFGWDQGLFAWVGDVVTQGGLPYRDAWDIKGPLTHYTFAFAQMIFGRNMWGIRIFDILLLAACCTALFRMVTLVTTSSVARWTVVLYGFWYAAGAYWQTAQPDGWVGMFLAIGLFPLAFKGDPASWYRWGGAGLAIGASALVKAPYAAFLLIPISLTFVDFREHRRSHAFGNLTAALVGTAVPPLVALTWFSAHGALPHAIEALYTYPASAYSQHGVLNLSRRLEGLVVFGQAATLVAVALPFGIFGWWSLRSSSVRAATLTLSWLVVGIGGVVLQGRFFTYHWLIVYPPIALLVACGVWKVARMEFLASSRSSFSIVATAVMVFHVSTHPMLETFEFFRYAAGLTTREAYYTHFGIPGDDLRAAQYLHDHTGESASVVVLGWNASVLYLSNRRSPTRFGYSMPLFMGEGNELRESYRSEFMRTLEASPPEIVVVGQLSEMILGTNYSVTDFPAFAAVLHQKYRRTQRFGHIDIYELLP